MYDIMPGWLLQSAAYGGYKDVLLNILLYSKIGRGSILLVYTSINKWFHISVEFSTPFKTVPTVLVTLREHNERIDRRLFISVYNETINGFDIWFYSTSETGTSGANWIAISD